MLRGMGVGLGLGLPFLSGRVADVAVAAEGGFSAWKETATGAADTNVAGFTEYFDTLGDFDATTGVWTPTNSGFFLMGTAGSAPANVAANVTWHPELWKDGAKHGEFGGRSRLSNANHGTNAPCFGGVLAVAGSDYSLRQITYTSWETVFWAAPFASSKHFAAYKTTGTGNNGEVITGFTEQFDVGDCFNHTTGVFTAPSTGLYAIAAAGWPGPTCVDQTELELNIGATPVAEGYRCYHDISGTSRDWRVSTGFLMIKKLTVGDEICLRQQVGTSGAYNMGNVQFSIALLNNVSVAFSARKGAATGAAGETIAGWTEDFDDGSNFNATTGVWTCPADGKYILAGGGHSNTGVAAGTTILFGQIDGGLVSPGFGRTYVQSLTQLGGHSIGYCFDLTAGQTLRLHQNGVAMKDCYFAVAEVA